MTVGKRATAPYGPAKTRPFRFGTRSPGPSSGEDPPLAIGAIVDGRYEITGLLGEGGMGRVYAAQHRFLGRRVALKVLHADAQTSADNVARFRQEALLTTRIGHPGIVEVLDCATLPDGRAFMVMEFLEGQTLEDAFATPGPADRRLGWLVQIAEALAAAHRVGVVHRDIKPANLFLVTGSDGAQTPKILDFGIAKAKDESGIQTQAGALLGTPYYLAPERALSRPLDARADLYSLGVILYELLTGDVPFVGATMMEVVGHHIHSAPLDPRQAAPDRPIPAAVAELSMDLLAKDPADRPADGDLLAARLRQLLRDHGDVLRSLITGPRELATAHDATVPPTDRSVPTLPPMSSAIAPIDRSAATVPPVAAAMVPAATDRSAATLPPAEVLQIDRGAPTVPPLGQGPVDRVPVDRVPVDHVPIDQGADPANASAEPHPGRPRLSAVLIFIAIAIVVVFAVVVFAILSERGTSPAGVEAATGPSSAGPSSAGPSSAGPSSAGPSSADPSSADPSSAGPSSAGPSSADPSSAGTTDAGSTSELTTHGAGETSAASGTTAVSEASTSTSSTSAAAAPQPPSDPRTKPRPSKKTKPKKAPTKPPKSSGGPSAASDGPTIKTDVYDD